VVEEADGDLMGDGVNIAARLEGICKPGAVCLSEDAYRQVRDRIKEEFVDLGEKALKNIARPVRVYEIKIDSEPSALLSVRSDATKREPPRLSIVVLPFANIGADSGQDYFVDGVTESVTTDFSQMSGMRVIGRNTAFSYKDKALDLKRIGRELNIRYVLEGSVQRSANRIRVNVQLIDAESGDHLWAERFDKTVADLFDMQDEIVARLANALNVQLIIAEARRAERAPSPDSMDLYFQGMSAYNSGLTPDRLSEACRLFERALALDRDNVDAIVGAARTESAFAWSHMSDNRASHLAAAESLAIKALSIAPEKAPGHVCLGVVRIYTNRVAQGIAELERALAIDRNLAEAHGYIGIAKCFLGRAEDTEGHVHNALRLSPRDTFAYLFLSGCRESLSRQGRRSCLAIAPRDRDQPAFPPRAFLPRDRLGGAWPARRGARGSGGRAFYRCHLHHPPVPRRCAQRQPGLSRRAAAHLRTDARGWGPGRIASRQRKKRARRRSECDACRAS